MGLRYYLSLSYFPGYSIPTLLAPSGDVDMDILTPNLAEFYQLIFVYFQGLSPYLNIDTSYLQSSPEYIFDQETKRGKENGTILRNLNLYIKGLFTNFHNTDSGDIVYKSHFRKRSFY